MKIKFLLLPIITLIGLSCNNRTNDKLDVPDALSESDSYELYSKRSQINLVDALYADLAKKTPELDQLEKNILAMKKSKEDSLEKFQSFNQKNSTYYEDAIVLKKKIKDSLLRNKINALILESSLKYKASIKVQQGLINKIDQQIVAINDLHVYLKIIKTLPLIEQYQRTHDKATVKPLEGYLKEVDKTFKLVDTITKK